MSKRFGRQPPHCRKNAPVWPSMRRHCLKQEFLKGGGGSFEEWKASATQLNHRWSTVVFNTSKTMTSHTLSWLDAPVERTNVDSSKKYRFAVPILSSPRLLLKTNSNRPCQEFMEKYILIVSTSISVPVSVVCHRRKQLAHSTVCSSLINTSYTSTDVISLCFTSFWFHEYLHIRSDMCQIPFSLYPDFFKEVGRESFQYKAPSEWNNLPLFLRSITSFHCRRTC